MGNKKNTARDALVRALVYSQGFTYARAAASSGLTYGQVAGVAHRTPHRLRAILTGAS